MNSLESQSSSSPQQLAHSNHQQVFDAIQQPHHHSLNSNHRLFAFKNQDLQHDPLQSDKHEPLLHEFLQQRNTDLEMATSTHLNLITELKIKIAVLENDVHRYTLDKEASANGLAAVIQAVARGPLNYGCTSTLTEPRNENEKNLGVTRLENKERSETSKTTQGLELEIQMLRKTNRRLSRQLRWHSDGRKHCRRRTSLSVSSSREQSSSSMMQDGSGDHTLDSSLPEGSCAENDTTPRCVPHLLSGPAGVASNEISAGTVPVPADDKQGLTHNSTSKDSEHGFVPTCDPDYGMRSLSDLIDQESTEAVRQQVQREDITLAKILQDNIDREDDDDVIDEGLLEEMKRFTNVPEFSVLQTGIAINEGFQKGDPVLAVKGVSGMDMSRYALTRSDSPSPSSLRQEDSNHSSDALQSLVIGPQRIGCWSTSERRNGAIELHQQFCDRHNRFPLFFMYEIQYRPQRDYGYRRTVLISDLPKHTELREVLARVRGGGVIFAILANTMKIAGSMSALVTFKSESDASRYVDFCAVNSLQFPTSSSSGGDLMIPRATLLPSATYPQKELAPDRSRCLCVDNFPRHHSIRSLERNIACDNAYRAAALTEVWIDEYRTLHLEFSSTGAAGSAFAILTHWQCYRELIVQFERDPCVGDLHELLAEMEPRKSMFPSSGFVDDIVVPVREQEAEMEEKRKWGGPRINQELADAEEGDLVQQFPQVTSSALQSGYSTVCGSEIAPSKHANLEERVNAISMPDSMMRC